MTDLKKIIDANYERSVADFMAPINKSATMEYMSNFFRDEFSKNVKTMVFPGQRTFLKHYEDRYSLEVFENLESKCYPMSFIKMCLGGVRIAEESGSTITDEDRAAMRMMESIGGYCFHVVETPEGETEVSIIEPMVTDIYVDHNSRQCYHSVDAPAREFADGTAMYAINGVLLGNESRDLFDIELTPENIKKICQIKNIDERAALMGKYGIENFVESGKVVALDDSVSEYKVIDMSAVYDDREAKFLYMRNLSESGKYHLEGVSNDCKTVQDAIDFRAAEFLAFIKEEHWTPCSIDGVSIADGDKRMRQQGDKLLFTPGGKIGNGTAKYLTGRNSIGGVDTRHTVKNGKMFEVADSGYDTLIELLKTDGTDITHPEHGTETISGDTYVGTVRQMDHETGIIEDVLD